MSKKKTLRDLSPSLNLGSDWISMETLGGPGEREESGEEGRREGGEGARRDSAQLAINLRPTRGRAGGPGTRFMIFFLTYVYDYEHILYFGADPIRAREIEPGLF